VGRRVFWKGPKCFKLCPIVLNYVQDIFPAGGGENNFFGYGLTAASLWNLQDFFHLDYSFAGKYCLFDFHHNFAEIRGLLHFHSKMKLYLCKVEVSLLFLQTVSGIVHGEKSKMKIWWYGNCNLGNSKKHVSWTHQDIVWDKWIETSRDTIGMPYDDSTNFMLSQLEKPILRLDSQTKLTDCAQWSFKRMSPINLSWLMLERNTQC